MARLATEHQRVTSAAGATGELPQEDTVKELIAREHSLIRRHLTHMRRVADEAQHEVPLTLRNRLDAGTARS